jgi:hypothetical protein
VFGCAFTLGGGTLFAETVSGNGYIVEQTIAPLQGSVSGNGYTVTQGAQTVGGVFSGGGSVVYSLLGIGTSTSYVTSTTTPPSITTTSFTTRGGYYILPQTVSTDSAQIPREATGTPVRDTTILTNNGSSCKTRITFSGPIDIRLNNNKNDVMKLETFLNVYEGEKLPVNGVYEKHDIDAVKRWQIKYRTFVLDPMHIRYPTGTVYTLSQRQIERQTTSSCGEPIIVTACPFFRSNVRYGDKGEEVKKVQQFLNVVEGEKLPLSGVFGPLTREAVKRFQKSRRVYVVTFIPVTIATGNWYTTTRLKANETIGCDILK